MPAYAIAHLQDSSPHADVLEYMDRIQATLDPFGGRFLVHGAQVEVMEGSWPGHLVMIGFPGIAEARAWYASPAYQAIMRLRADHIPGDLVLVDGVAPGYDPGELAAKLRAAGNQVGQ